MKTLQDILTEASKDNKGIFLLDSRKDSFISYHELYKRALSVLHHIQTKGIRPGREVILQLDRIDHFLYGFWACILGGIIPVPLTVSHLSEHKQKLVRIYSILNDAYVLTDCDLQFEEVPFSDERLIHFKSIDLVSGEGKIFSAAEDQIAFIQFSSGSTGEPKGVTLTHANLMANLRAILNGISFEEGGRSLNWMPFTHDMGLIGGHLAPLLGNATQYQLPTALFIRRPSLWMKKTSDYRIQFLASPNFGYKYFLDYFRDDTAGDWDLSHVKLILNGAEPISHQLCQEFLERMAPYGLQANVFFPVYGMAEASLAVTFPPVGEGLTTICLDRNRLSKGMEVKELPTSSQNGVVFVDEGLPVQNCQVRVCDDADREVPELTVGQIQIRGKSVTGGYYNNLEATVKLKTADGWLRTGDLGLLRNGRLIVTGREKDILFINGQNYYPQDIERVAEKLDGVELGRVVACGVRHVGNGEDDLILFLYAKKDWNSFIPLALNLKRQIKDQIGLEVKEVIPVRRIPKTTSGKVQRFKLTEQYQSGEFAELIQEIHHQYAAKNSQAGRGPVTKTEERLLSIVSSVLGINEISVTDPFYDLGIDSLKLVRLSSAIADEFQTELSAAILFELDNIAELALYLEAVEMKHQPSIPSADRSLLIPVLPSQQRLYVLEQLEGAGISNHITFAIEVAGKLEKEQVASVLRQLAMAHEALRTTFEVAGQKLYQKVNEPAPVLLTELQCDEESSLQEVIEDWKSPFSLDTYPLWKVGIQRREEGMLIVFDFHHLIMDGSSVMIFIKNFFDCLSGSVLPAPAVSFNDWCLWRKETVDAGKLIDQEAYWQQCFSDEVPVLELPTDFPRPLLQRFEGESVTFESGEELTAQIKTLAVRTGTTPFMILLAAYYVLLMNYSRQEDLVVGSSFSGRTHPDVSHSLGMFINTLPLRVQSKRNTTFREHLQTVKETVVSAFQNQDYQTEELIEKLQIKPDWNRNPLFDTVFVMQNMASPAIKAEWEIRPVQLERKTAKVDLALECIMRDNKFLFTLEYSSALFLRQTMERLGGHYVQLLREIVEEPDACLAELDMMGTDERNHVVYGFNNTAQKQNGAETIPELFIRQAEWTPNKMALRFEEGTMTYGELNTITDGIARRLRNQGIGRESVVGIFMENGPEQIVAMLAIMKAGGAYLPIDPAYPEERIRYILEDCSPSLVMINGNQTDILSSIGIRELMDISAANQWDLPSEKLELLCAPHDLALILYTSGTTGQPKGVMLDQRNLTAYVGAFQKEFELTDQDVVLQQASFAFDNFVEEVYPALCSGASLLLMKKESVLDIPFLLQQLQEEGVTVISCSSRLINEINKHWVPRSLRLVISGGDVLKREYIDNLLKHCTVYNTYGPTEATVCASYYRCDTNTERIPIGKPIRNYRIYVVDDQLRPVPVGIPGQLCIAGDGVARGYWGKADLTAEKFTEEWYVPGERIYLTGDVGRWLPNGNLEYLSRMDQQVKVRGYRIELSEVEGVLAGHEAVTAAAVIAREDQEGNRDLCAYVVSNQAWTVTEMRKHVAASLPEYMIPSYFVQLDRLPVNIHGKLEYSRLPDPGAAPHLDRIYTLPRNRIEEKIAEIWLELLGLSQVSIDDNFFELGGHSLKATILASRLEKAFETAVSVRTVFAEPTIYQLAEYLVGATKSKRSPIERTDRNQPEYKASSAQRRMYALNQMDKGSVAYNISKSLLVEGQLNQERLKQAIRLLMDRHDSLRTSFHFKTEGVVQRIHPSVEPSIEVVRIAEELLAEQITNYIKPFNLECPGLMRIVLFVLDETHHVLLFDCHHIVCDAVSIGILLKEFQQFYSGHELPELALQYRDFAVWHNELLKSEEILKQEAYWLQRFHEPAPVLDLSTDYVRPKVQRFEGDAVTFETEDELGRQLIGLAGATGSTLFMVLLSAYYALFHKYTGQEDFVVGMPVAGRSHSDTEPLVGMFVNTLPIRCRLFGKTPFLQLLNDVRAALFDAIEYQDYPFDQLIERLHVKRSAGRNVLFDTMFVMQNAQLPALSTEELIMRVHPHHPRASMFDMTLECIEIEGKLRFTWEYNTALFRRETMERMAGHYQTILRQIAENRDISLAELKIMDEQEEKWVLHAFNDTAHKQTREETIPERFIKQARLTPNRTALIFGDSRINYESLDVMSDNVALSLRNIGISRRSIVAVIADRGPEQIVALLGVMKAGAAYLPIDPDYPEDRIRYMLEDSHSSAVLTSGCGHDMIPDDIEVLDICSCLQRTVYAGDVGTIHDTHDLAYIIYTSGTTGRPKGVMVEHRNLAAYVDAFQETFELNGEDVVLQQASYSFDTYAEEVYPALTTGSAVLLVKKEDLREIPFLVKELFEKQVTVMSCTPLMLNELNKFPMPASLRIVIGGGDVLKWEHISNFLEQCAVYNTYGPTETTVCASYYRCEMKMDHIPIGKPIPGYKIFIVDKQLRPVPVGVPGQLCIAGAGLTRGYLGKPELTEEKFVSCDFAQGETIYLTGDVARWLPDGNLEYIGRVDEQVKIRGYRIEIGEVERTLTTHNGVAEAAVVSWADESGDPYLCAYFISKGEWNVTEMRRHLAKTLPDYMIPAFFVELEQFPMTTNGKLNRRALPNPKSSVRSDETRISPRNKLDEQLMELWKEVLGLSEVSLHDDFFEVGGHSLKAIELVSRIRRELRKDVSVNQVFLYSRLDAFSDELQEMDDAVSEPILPVIHQDNYALSSAQKRLFFIAQLESGSTAYNMPAAYGMEGDVSVDRLKLAWNQLINRHESIRTSFHLYGDEPRSFIQEQVPCSFEIIHSNGEQNIGNNLDSLIEPFDLGRAPLVRLKVLEISAEKRILLFDMHHIISDGVSIDTLMQELAVLYHGESLVPLSLQFKDYAEWQQAEVKSGAMKSHQDFWLKSLARELPELQFPADHIKTPDRKQSEGRLLIFDLDNGLSEQIEQLAPRLGVTPFMFLLAAYYILLTKYTSQEDLIVGVPVVGRVRPELERIVGMFVNTLPLRSYPEGKKHFRDYLEEVKSTVTEAFLHQELPMEMLLEDLKLPRSSTSNPLYSTLFSYREAEPEQLSFKQFYVKKIPLGVSSAKFDFSMEAIRDKHSIRFELIYDAGLFNTETMEALSRHFIQLLRTITAQPDIKISDISLLTAEEINRQLEWISQVPIDSAWKTIYQSIENQAVLTPSTPAVVFMEDSLTYAEMNGKANALARRLRELGIGVGSFVPVLMDRSLELAVSILAVMKAGAAFVPIDVHWPNSRIADILEDVDARVILAGRESPPLPEGQRAVMLIVTLDELSSDEENLSLSSSLDNPIYVIYTSGSTGKPKGVIVPHIGIANRFHWMDDYFGKGRVHTVLQTTHHVYDSAVWQIFWPLTHGGTTVLPDSQQLVLEAGKMSRIIEKHQVTLTDFVPSVFRIIVDELLEDPNTWKKLHSLQDIIVGGEEILPEAIFKFRKTFPHVRVTNLYGPTEASIGCVYHEVHGNEGGCIPIGKPIHNTQILILDKNMKLVPAGVIGEIYISGLCLAKAYLNDPAKTDSAFLMHPYMENGRNRVYKTGDLARYNRFGEIEYVGRSDHQVKIRGLRIEPGDIEAHLRRIDGIKEAIVVAKEIRQQTELCAYLISDGELDIELVRKQLAQLLPQYMIPSFFVQLPLMPLLPSGKLDRKNLPEPSLVPKGERLEPATEAEVQLLAIWEDVLGITGIGVTDDFFALGGHSLKLLSLSSRIQQMFHKTVPMKELYELTSVRSQARHLSSGKLQSFSMDLDIEDAWMISGYGKNNMAVASSSQKALFVVSNLEGISTSYNMPQVFELHGEIDERHFREAIQRLIDRHEVLRTYLELRDEELVQIVLDEYEPVIPVLDVQESRIAEVVQHFVQPFDLNVPPLFRAALVRTESRMLVMMDMHHIISDGESLSILTRDFVSLFQGAELPRLKHQFRHFAEWQRQMLTQGKWKHHEEYWLKQFDPVPLPLRMPTDYKRSDIQSFTGGTVWFDLDPDLSEKIRQSALSAGCTLFMLLLACYTVLLSKYTGQEDIVVGTPVSGRSRSELMDMVGMFVNTLPIRNRPKPDLSFLSYLWKVKENVLEGLNHQDYPFEELVRKLNVKRDGGSQVLFNTMFTVETLKKRYEPAHPLRPIHDEIWEDSSVKFDLILTARDDDKNIGLELEYADRLFKKQSIQAMTTHLLSVLEQVTADISIPLSRITVTGGKNVYHYEEITVADFDFED